MRHATMLLPLILVGCGTMPMPEPDPDPDPPVLECPDNAALLTQDGMTRCVCITGFVREGAACVAEADARECETDNDCFDPDGCTLDTCHVASGMCTHAPDNRFCDDGDPGTTDVCRLTVSGSECFNAEIECQPGFVLEGSACVLLPDPNEPVRSVQDIVDSTYLLEWCNDFGCASATGWAIDGFTIVTNAHVTEDMRQFSTSAVAIQSETGRRWILHAIWSHPEYDPGELSADVGIVEVQPGQRFLPSFIGVAPNSVASQLERFDDISFCGFPGELNMIDRNRPIATCLSGQVTAMRPFTDGLPANPSNTFAIQYDLDATPGTSGSALFDERNRIVGINAAAIGQQTFGVRADKINELMGFVDDLQGWIIGSSSVEFNNNVGVCRETGRCCEDDCDPDYACYFREECELP